MIDRLRTVEDVLAWCRLNDSEIVDVIVQDEYTHDVLVRTAAPTFLAFDTT